MPCKSVLYVDDNILFGNDLQQLNLDRNLSFIKAKERLKVN